MDTPNRDLYHGSMKRPGRRELVHRSDILNALLEEDGSPETTLRRFLDPFSDLAVGALDILRSGPVLLGKLRLDEQDRGVQKSLTLSRDIICQSTEQILARVGLEYSETNPMDSGLNLSTQLVFPENEHRLGFSVTTWMRTASDLRIFGEGFSDSQWLRFETLLDRVFEGKRLP